MNKENPKKNKKSFEYYIAQRKEENFVVQYDDERFHGKTCNICTFFPIYTFINFCSYLHDEHLSFACYIVTNTKRPVNTFATQLAIKLFCNLILYMQREQ